MTLNDVLPAAIERELAKERSLNVMRLSAVLVKGKSEHVETFVPALTVTV